MLLLRLLFAAAVLTWGAENSDVKISSAPGHTKKLTYAQNKSKAALALHQDALNPLMMVEQMAAPVAFVIDGAPHNYSHPK